jgi:predicted nuclease of predicted toxin-antitoxin system
VKVLLDTCVWYGVRDELAPAGHDVQWVGDWPADPGDDEILHAAFSENRALVTLDNDFEELAVHQAHPHAGIIKLVDLHPKNQGMECLKAIIAYTHQLQSGAIVTDEPGRVRVRLAMKDDG